jgi:hypothetical protein
MAKLAGVSIVVVHIIGFWVLKRAFQLEIGQSSRVDVPESSRNIGLQLMTQKRVIAMYLPQFQQLNENNETLEEDSTGFTNVDKIQKNRYEQPIIRPAERMGYYDLMSRSQRRFQGELAKMYGVHGFAIYHYWFGTKAILTKPLELMLSDGYPDIPFCLTWTNEPWTRRMDGENGSEVLLDQIYDRESWKPHFDWLLSYFKHPSYLKYKGLPIIVLHRADNIPDLKEMTNDWKAWVKNAGLPGLYFIQVNGVSGKAIPSWALQPGIDSVAEFFPNYMTASGATMNNLVSTGKSADSHFFGVSAAFDNSPTHPAPKDHPTIFPFHPSHLYFWLRQNLARTEPGGFVFLNAWNGWEEGAAIEPSVQWGRRWLEAVRQAVHDEQRGHVANILPDGFVSSVPLEHNPGMPEIHKARQDKVCIIVRTYKNQTTGIYNIHQLLNSLLALDHQNWKAFVVNTDVTPFENLQSIVDLYEHEGKIEISPLAPQKSFERDTNSPYEVTDKAIIQHCGASKEFKWLLVTNGDNWYTPDALDFLPSDVDLVFMNFYSRWSLINMITTTNTPDDQACCVRLADFQCMVADAKIGSIDLGAIIFDYQHYAKEQLSFTMFNGESDARCGVKNGGCHDGIMIEYLMDKNWSYRGHPVDVCTMHHNANPRSCEMVGGTWYDTTNRAAIGCYYGSQKHILPMPLENVNYQAYMSSEAACVC